MMILLIALLHALPIFLVGCRSQSKALLWLVASISAAVAFLTGNPAFIAADLIAIAVSLWNCLELINTRATELPPTSQVVQPVYKTEEAGGDWTWVAIFVGFLAFLYLLSYKTKPAAVQQQAPSISDLTPVSGKHSSLPNAPTSTVKKRDESGQPPVRRIERLTAEQCLRIVDEGKMVQCLQTVK